MIVKLESGFEAELNEANMESWEFLKAIRKVDKGDLPLIVDVAEMLLGSEEEVDRLADHLKETTGSDTVEAMAEAIQELMNTAEIKN
jgi:hypothetical protein